MTSWYQGIVNQTRRAEGKAATKPPALTTATKRRFVTIAEEKTIPPTIQTLTVPEAQALADRLLSRSLFVASPEVRQDLCMASRAIRSTLHEVDRMAAYCEDDAARLRAFTIDVGGADACPDPNGKRALRQFFTATGRT